MSEFSIPYEFIAGTKAKAEEVNANFNAVKNELTQKASKNGSATATLSVANATLPEHAINKSQLDALSKTLETKIDSKTVLFCAKSGNTTEGRADLFESENLTITAKVSDGLDGNHLPLVVANSKGEMKTKTTFNSISMSGKVDGDYNIFTPIDGDAYVLKNKIYRQAKSPTMLENDIWLNTSIEPLKAFKYSGSENVEFNDIPIGSVKIAEGAITALTTNPYNQNGYIVNSLSKDWAMAMPDYAKSISKNNNVTYSAEGNGYLFWYRRGVNGEGGITINNVNYPLQTDSPNWTANGIWIPIAKDDVYYTNSSSSFMFIPCRGN